MVLLILNAEKITPLLRMVKPLEMMQQMVSKTTSATTKQMERPQMSLKLTVIQTHLSLATLGIQ